MLKTKLSAIALACTGLTLGGCLPTDDEENAAAAGATACGVAEESFTTSDGRTVCVSLAAFKAQAPFETGFKAPGKVIHTVFLRDEDGNPVDVANDGILTAVSQYPMMYMNSGHQHSTAHAHNADATNGEYGVYNLDTYYVMAGVMGTEVMGRWEYRVKVTDNMGTIGDASDDMQHTVTFHPTVESYPMTKAYRVFTKNAGDEFRNGMGELATRRYAVWLDSVGEVAAGGADIKLYVTTEDMDPGEVPEGHEGHMGHNHNEGGEDSQHYPAVSGPMGSMAGTALHGGEEMVMNGETMIHTNDVDVTGVTVEVSTDAGANWTTLAMAGMEHDDMGYFSGNVPMTAGDVDMLVKITVDQDVTDEAGNAASRTLLLTQNGVADDTATDADGTGAEAMPVLKFTATAAL